MLAFVTALGLWRALAEVVSRSVGRDRAPRALALSAACLAALLVGLGIRDTAELRPGIQQRAAYTRAFARTLGAIHEPKAVVFLRYHPRHNPHRSLIENPPDFGRARIWVARDRGEDNLRLIAGAPDRVPYLFDEASDTLFRLEKQP